MSIKYDSKFIQRYKRTTKSKTPILFFHTYTDDGRIETQGVLYYLNAEGVGKVYTCDWLFGEPGDHTVVTKAFLSRCTFYDNQQEWRNAGDEKLGLSSAEAAKGRRLQEAMFGSIDD